MANLTHLYDKVENYTDLSGSSLKQIEYVFAYYNDLKPGTWVKIDGWQDVNAAKKMILEPVGRYNSKHDRQSRDRRESSTVELEHAKSRDYGQPITDYWPKVP